MRLDIFLQTKGYVNSRSKARELIKNGKVLVNDSVAIKCGLDVNDGDKIELLDVITYVSRAGHKIEGAYEEFNLSFKDLVILDIGASTGGFCDFCLKHGAKKVYALDVGTNQLDRTLKQDKRVVDMQNTDIRNLDLGLVSDMDVFVCDVSFISLTKISNILSKLLDIAKYGVVLIKPQFECGKEIAKKSKGIIKDEKVHKLVIDSVKKDFLSQAIKIEKLTTSKILGGDGNVEYLALVKKLT